MKKLGKLAFAALTMVFAITLTSCGTKYCDYCGAEAVWKAQETFLGKPMDDEVYVCADCKRKGKGPYVSLPGNTITWTHL